MNSNMNFDSFNTGFEDFSEEIRESIEEEERKEQLRQQMEAQQLEEEERIAAEAEDPRNREGFGGVRGFAKEVTSAIGGGLQDTASSLVTLPERAIDMFSGEMEEEMQTEEGYKPEWDDAFVNDENPIETKTWWGGALRGLVHFGSLAVGIIPAMKAAGVGAATTVAGSLVRGAAIGATSDLVSRYSQDDNGLAVLRDNFGLLDTPFSTKDTDHPAMKTLKNVVEGMGIGVLFDAAGLAIKRGVRKVPANEIRVVQKELFNTGDYIIDEQELSKVLARNESVQAQIAEKGIEQLQLPGFGAYKNKNIASPTQAAPTSTGSPYNVKQQLKRIRTEYGAEGGSTDSVTTPVSLDRMKRTSQMAEAELVKLMKIYMSDARVKEEVAKAKSLNKPLHSTWQDSIELAQQIMEGRNTSELTADEFWDLMNRGKTTINTGTADEIAVWDPKNVAAADLVIGSLLKEIRDSGITNRELYNYANLTDVDGPAKATYDKVIAGLTQIKLSKYTHSNKFRQFKIGKEFDKTTKEAIHEAVNKQMAESKAAHKLAFEIAGTSDNDDLFKAIHEAISFTGEIHTLNDYDNYIRKKFRGGKIKGKTEQGLIVKGLGKVMVNSVLSGPKTPMRAIMGTGAATFLRPLSMAVGAGIRGDGATLRASMAAMNAMRESIPEAWELFRHNLNGYWSGDIATVKTRFNQFTKGDEQWAMYTDWIENSGRATDGDKLAFHIANGTRALNDNKFLTYSTKIMGATDDAFGLILARATAKERAMREAMDLFNAGKVTEISPQMLKEAQERFYKQIMDGDGNIIDEAALYAKKEATLTNELQGFSAKLDAAFESSPWTKPFLLFARTGMNGLALTAKHTPLFNRLVKESRDIMKATPDNLSDLAIYGIRNAQDLANAKALRQGRIAIGSSLILLANMHYVNGGLTGNGPADRQKRQTWIDAGWRPRSIKIGNVWVGYDSFEPFNLILSTIGDIGDHYEQMGPEWTEEQYRKLSIVIMQGLSSKSYLASMQQFVDLFAGKPGSMERIIASIANNTIPLSSLRNELGKVFNPYMKEINSGLLQSFRNRNLYLEGVAAFELPTKYDTLTGKPIRNWDFPTRLFNMFSPFTVNLDYSKGRKLLFDSGYDLRTTTYSYEGIDFSKNARVRSLFAKAIGDQNIEAQLNALANNPKIINSLNQMMFDMNNGNRGRDPMKAYVHNAEIKRIFQIAKRKAFNKIRNHPEVKQLIKERDNRRIDNLKSLKKTGNYRIKNKEAILNLRNK